MKRNILLLCVTLQQLQTIPMPVLGSPHSNQCIQNLGGILSCGEIGLFNLFSGVVSSCCEGLKDLVVDGCRCNPLIGQLLGPQGKLLSLLQPVCRIVHPLAWLSVPLWRDCEAVKSYDYGCGVSDAEIDSGRYGSLDFFNGLFKDNQDESKCFDTPAFVDSLREAIREDAVFFVAYGAGYYIGPENIAEYMGIPFASLNHGFWFSNNEQDTTGKKEARFDIEANVWYLGSTRLPGTYYRGTLPYDEHYIEQRIHFEGCETKIAQYIFLGDKGILDGVIVHFAQAAQYSKRYGIEDTCRVHTVFCADNPDTRQYESEQECIDYIRSLPMWTEACGKNRLFGGHSIPCKWKHHLMVPTNPLLHCPHIGKLGVADKNGDLKCDDVAECSQDDGQDSWPPVYDVGNDTPLERIQFIENNNIGYEDEPLGCAIPYPPDEDR